MTKVNIENKIFELESLIDKYYDLIDENSDEDYYDRIDELNAEIDALKAEL